MSATALLKSIAAIGPANRRAGGSAARQKRLKAYRLGHWAEFRAAWSLRLKGYRIVARRFKTGSGEIDLIARKGDLVIFVEVKARRDERLALDSVGHRARKRISAAANHWLTRQADIGGLSWRFDVIAVTPRRWPVHIENVW